MVAVLVLKDIESEVACYHRNLASHNLMFRCTVLHEVHWHAQFVDVLIGALMVVSQGYSHDSLDDHTLGLPTKRHGQMAEYGDPFLDFGNPYVHFGDSYFGFAVLCVTFDFLHFEPDVPYF